MFLVNHKFLADCSAIKENIQIIRMKYIIL